MLSGQGAIPLLTTRASRWPPGLWRRWTPDIQQGADDSQGRPGAAARIRAPRT
jgi:hypothetical protein